ncbi:MAG TPA: DUF4265 domain-containing protein [Bryobacteraceae bacterium]|nr:DUF4265 domain-containing protein [Bryobacteraceae bacterium]
MAEDHIKVLFELKKDADGYPPADTEGLWAEPLGDNLFKIDNVPFFVKGISCEDVVEAAPDSQGELRYRSLVRPSAHNSLRVIVFRESPDSRPLEERVADLRRQLEQVGCSTELSHMPGLIAVDTDAASMTRAIGMLQSGEKANLWEYEEGAVRN